MTRNELLKAFPLNGKTKRAQFFWRAWNWLMDNDPVHPIIMSKIEAQDFIKHLELVPECFCPDFVCLDDWRKSILKARWEAWKQKRVEAAK